MAKRDFQIRLRNRFAGDKLIRVRRGDRSAVERFLMPMRGSSVKNAWPKLAETRGRSQESLGMKETVAFGEFTPTHF